MLKEGQSNGHELAYDLFNEIESKFCEYGNHIARKDENGKKAEEHIKGFFNYFNNIHYLAIEENISKEPDKRKKIVDKFNNSTENKIYDFDNLNAQTIRNRFRTLTQNIL